MVFGTNSQKVDLNNQTAVNEHMIKEIDEIKRYVAATYSSVDTEIQELHNLVQQIEKQLKETDGQIDRMEKMEPMMRNIEKTMRNIEGKMPR